MTYVILAWIVLGVHSSWYLIRGITKKYDFTTSDLPQLVIAFILPIVAHIATYSTYFHKSSDKLLFRKRS